MSGFIDYYELLEVSPRASREVIELAYKAIAKKYHPDLNDSSKREFYNIRMALINEARTVLTDPYKRDRYDYKYRSQQIKYTDKSQTNRTSTFGDSKSEPEQPPKSTAENTTEKKESGNHSNHRKNKANVSYKKEGNAFEYFSIPFSIFLILLVAVVIFSLLLRGSTAQSASSDTRNAISTMTSHTTIETTRIPTVTSTFNSITPSDTAEYIKENILSIPDFSWQFTESGSTTFDIDLRNNSSKTINSITIKVVLCDQDRNILTSTDNGAKYAALLMPGPIEPNEIGGLGRHWSNVFTNKNAASSYIDNIEIAYEDGTTYTIKKLTTALFE